MEKHVNNNSNGDGIGSMGSYLEADVEKTRINVSRVHKTTGKFLLSSFTTKEHKRVGLYCMNADPFVTEPTYSERYPRATLR
jgi:hypothetical protein